MNDATTGCAKIALAEDDDNLRKTYVAMLNMLGYSVTVVASNGAELLELSEGQPIDLAIVDFDMPLVDGLAVAEEFSRLNIPVVLVSGHPEAEDLVVEKEPIAIRLLKPVTIGGLERAIEFALAGGES